MAIQALIFDFDGLILDTEGPIFASYQELYRRFSCDLTLEGWADSIGKSEDDFDPYASLEAQLGRPIDRAQLDPPRRLRERELILAQPVLPGVESYLRDGQKLGLKIGLASSSVSAWVVGHLSRLGLLDYFQAIKTREDVEHAKPDPALYQLALSELAVSPDAAVVFEDSPNGVLAARRAGIYTVAVPNPLTRLLPLEQADLRLKSLAELALDELLQRVAAANGKPAGENYRD